MVLKEPSQWDGSSAHQKHKLGLMDYKIIKNFTLKLAWPSHNVATAEEGMMMYEYELTLSEIWEEYNVKPEKHDSIDDKVDGRGVDTWTDMWRFAGKGMTMNE